MGYICKSLYIYIYIHVYTYMVFMYLYVVTTRVAEWKDKGIQPPSSVTPCVNIHYILCVHEVLVYIYYISNKNMLYL